MAKRNTSISADLAKWGRRLEHDASLDEDEAFELGQLMRRAGRRIDDLNKLRREQ